MTDNMELTDNTVLCNIAADDSDIALLVCSCDKYEDAWELCFRSISDSWRDCPYKRVLLTESKKEVEGCDFDRIINVDSTVWSDMLHEALGKIQEEFIIFMLEDQWSVTQVDQKRIADAVDYMRANSDTAVIYFETAKPGGVKKSITVDDRFNEIPFGSPYRLSCAPGIFRKSFLYELTKQAISPWEFERVMSFDEIGRNVKILELKNSNWTRIDETGAIFRGKWVPGVAEYARKLGVELNLDVRPVQSGADVFKRRVKDFVFNLNPGLIVSIQRKLAD